MTWSRQREPDVGVGALGRRRQSRLPTQRYDQFPLLAMGNPPELGICAELQMCRFTLIGGTEKGAKKGENEKVPDFETARANYL
jgi:hypothetical protein